MRAFKFHQAVVGLLVMVWCSLCFGQEITIGALIDDETNNMQAAIRKAVKVVNSHNLEPTTVLRAQTVKVPYGNEFQLSKKLCRLLKSGVAAVIGPTASSSAYHAQSVCDTKEMPYIDTRYDFTSNLPGINLHPYPRVLANVFVDLVKAWGWKGFSVLYEDSFWLPQVAELLKLYDFKGSTVTLRRFDLGLNGNYRSVLRRVKLSNDFNIVIDCSVKVLPEVLKQAQQVGLLTDKHSIFITSLDLHTLNLEPYQYSGTNMTGIRLVDPTNAMVKVVTELIFAKKETEETDPATKSESVEDETEEKDDTEDTADEDASAAEDSTDNDLTPFPMSVQTALAYDAVLLFAEAVKDLMGPKGLEMINLSCDGTDTWKNGYSIINYMKTSVVHGLTGEIKFDNQGLRSEFAVDLIELGLTGLIKVGTWNSSEGLNISRANIKPHSVDDDAGSLKNKTFIVLTALSDPYGMLRKTPAKLTGNDRFEGFGIELIDELSMMLGFNYTFKLQEDSVYGSLNKETGEWNGMIRELIDYRADLAITDLTITSERESGADFTMPFMNLGISILYRKPTKEPPSLFSFMSPFSNEVWLYLGIAYVGVSLCLFLVGRISPSEWDNPYPCVEEPEALENQFSFRNSMWFTVGALLQQGTEIAPKAPSTRTIASLWWFFTLIMVSSYTANLAAFLTIESITSPINNAEDLANANGAIKYGAKRGGSTFNFFKDAEYGTYKKMYDYMSQHPELMTSTNTEGLNRVKNENYAYLMESTSIEYIVERECDVTQIGGLLDDKGYGIAMRKYSPYRSALSEAVLRLQEQGKLTAMKRKWWKEKRGGGKCTTTEDDGAEELGIANVGGVFVVVILGCCFSSLYGIFEIIVESYKNARKHKVSFKDEVMAEFRFIMQCTGNTKTVRHRKGSSSDSSHSTATVESGASSHSDHTTDSKSKLDSAAKMSGKKKKANANGNGVDQDA